MDALRAGIGDWGLGIGRCRPEGLRYRIRIAAITLLLFAPLAPLYAQPLPPELTKAVNDFANVIEPASEAELERRIVELKNASGDVVVVATIDTFAPYGDIREYAVQMFANRGRGIGARAKDNGLLVLLAVRDRRVWMEVGYDLEQFVTDGLAGEISRNDMAPHFARGDYGQGLLAGVTRVIGRIAQERGVTLSNVPVDTDTRDRGSRITISPWIIFLIIFVIILMNSGGGPRSRMRRRTHWGSPGWSGWNSGVGPFGGGGRIGGGGFGGGFGGFGGGRSGGGGGGAGW